MSNAGALVSIGMPVRNGERVIAEAVQTVLSQDHENLEVVISDNASGDGTEEICRALAGSDPRVRYHRQPRNIGLLGNFRHTIQLARGTYFKWVGDDNRLEPSYLSRCLEVFAEDDRLLLVTTRQLLVDSGAQNGSYPRRLASDSPVERFEEMLNLLTAGQLLLDPIYGVMCRDTAVAIPRRNMLREDEIFAAKLALAGPWGHVPQVLARRGWKAEPLSQLARRLDVPVWQARAAAALQCRELLDHLRQVELTPAERRAARLAVARLYFRRHRRTAAHRGRRLMTMAKDLAPTAG